MKRSLRLALWILLAAAPPVAKAQSSDIRIENAWSRAAMAGRTGVVYLTITDKGAPDRVTGAASPVANTAELHESYMEQGIAKMRPVRALDVGPDKPVKLAPGGFHIMLVGLKQALKQGDSFPVTLSFEKAGPITATVTVGQSGGGMNGHNGMGHMQHP